MYSPSDVNDDVSENEEGMVDRVLLADDIEYFRAVVASKNRGVLLVGGDDFSRRAIVDTVLPTALLISCARPDDIRSLDVLPEVHPSSTCAIILTSANTSNAERPVRTALRKASTVIALAPSEVSVAPSLRRAGRLEHTVRLTSPSFHARESAWNLILTNLHIASSDTNLARRLASASPAFGLKDFRNVLYSAMASSANGKVDPSHLLLLVENAIPSIASGLQFVSYGSRAIAEDINERDGWKNVGGYSDVKSAISKLAEWPVLHSDAFSRLGVDPPRGLLLYGPSGCGKTLIVESLLSQVHYANWIRVDGTSLFSQFLGDSEARIRALFRQARNLEPCIVFIDDIEAVGGNRQHDETGVERRVLGALLAELDGTAPGRVFLLACTEHLDDVDPALVRSGRIDNVIEVGMPSLNDRRHILEVLLRKMALETTVDPQVTDVESNSLVLESVCFELAEKSRGFTGARLARMCREATLYAMRETPDAKVVLLPHFERALESMLTWTNLTPTMHCGMKL